MAAASFKEEHSSLIERVETMASVIELLLETLNNLSDAELEKFKELQFQIHFNACFSHPQWELLMLRDVQDTVFLMALTDGQESVENTKKVLKMMDRIDVVQRLSHSCSGPKEKHSVDEHLTALIRKVATMSAVKELLLETLKNLTHDELISFKWLLQFTFFQRGLPHISFRQLLRANTADRLADAIVEMCGQKSLEVTKVVFMDMNRTDLVKRLSDISSAPEEKHFAYDHWPALIQKVETMASVIELLLETLADLSEQELNHTLPSSPSFKQILLSQDDFCRSHPDITLMLLDMRDMQDVVFLMVLVYGQQSVEKTMDVLEKMKKSDLVQRMSNSSPRPKEQCSTYKYSTAVNQKVATMAAVKHLLLETLNLLNNEELEKFKKFLQLIFISLTLSYTADRAKIVDQMLQIYNKQSVALTREVFMDMKRPDLVKGLSLPSSGLKGKHTSEHQPALLRRAVPVASVKQILLETLKDLSLDELEKFKWFLQFTYFQKSLPQISWSQLDWADSAALIVDLMVGSQQSVEVTREVLMDMNRTDLVERFSGTSSGSKGKQFFKPLQKDVTITPLQENLMEILKELSYKELEEFKQLVQRTGTKKGLQKIPRPKKKKADKVQIMELMVEIYGQQSVEVTREALKKMNRTDVVERFSGTSSGSKGKKFSKPPESPLTPEFLKKMNQTVLLKKFSVTSSGSQGPLRSLELEGCGSIKQPSGDWTKVDPDVSPTYSLQSEAGSFECRVSGLSWVCKEKVSFKYQFCSWEKHMERMENIEYMPAGPLIDITVIAGKFDAVYLPHWICIDENPKISDKFAVLHINDYGDVVEPAAEVTPSHVKLTEPVFSPRAVLMKAGFPVKINCKELDKKELSYGYTVIRKPNPEKSLKMHDSFHLTADVDGAEIYPDKLKLRYESTGPNFFEVFIKNPDRNFTLKLTQRYEWQPIWTSVIRKDEYQITGHTQGEHFVNKHQWDLIEKVSNIGPILDHLQRDGVIQQEEYDIISAIPTTQDKMRRLFSGPLKAGGHACKDIFYTILVEKESYLVAGLRRKEY